MEHIIINGGRPLYGNVSINGMKNAALPIISACILNEEPCIIDNIPPVSDIETLLDILASIGADIRRLTKNSVEISCKNVVPCSSPRELAEKLRGSSYLLGAEFGRFAKASVSHPGGCSIGARPLDLHMKAFEALGADCVHRNGRLEVTTDAPRPVGNTIYFDKISVGATLVPHAEILNNIIKPTLEKYGWELKVMEFSDYVLPNTSLEEGELDANYFQTLGYLNGQNEERGMHLVAAVGVHIEPMGIYSAKIKDLKELADGASIGVPNDTDNYGRAIDFLNALGLLQDAPTDPEKIGTING
jgi:hypothetical protein